MPSRSLRVGAGRAFEGNVCRELGADERLVDLIAYFKRFRPYAWANDGPYVDALSAIAFMHKPECGAGDAGYSATPTCMDGRDSSRTSVIQENGHTVGRGHADASVGEGRGQCIHAFEGIVHIVLGDLSYASAMNLMGNYEVTVVGPELLA